MKKALEILASATPTKIRQVVLLVGEDFLQKQLVVQHLIAQQGFQKDQVETLDLKTANEIAGHLMEGSLFGDRCLNLNFIGKTWGKMDQLNRAIEELGETGDYAFIKTEINPAQELAWTTVECNPPSHVQTRAKLIMARAKDMKLTLNEEVKKRLVERTVTSLDVENALRTLTFIPTQMITTNHVEKATPDPEVRRDLIRAVLVGNIIRISKELREGEPLQVLGSLHATLMRAYVFIEMTRVVEKSRSTGLTKVVKEKKSKPTPAEERAMELLRIPGRNLKEWREIRKRCASRVIRSLMEAVAEARDDVLFDPGLWQEKLQMKLGTLGARGK